MKKALRILAAFAVIAGAASCASSEKMVKMAENVSVTCTPAVLEAVAGNIDATVSVTYPADYFDKKAILEVTPVLVYEGGEAKMQPFIYQGEAVKDNYKAVSSAGQTVKEKIHFDYVEGMEKSYLELRGVVKSGSKGLALPAKKVAEGVNTTYMLVKDAGVFATKEDGYQATYIGKEEGQILYTVNSSEVRGSELKSISMQDFETAIDRVLDNKGAKITSTEIVAYASPEGAEDHNNKLSSNRSESASKAWDKILKDYDIAAPEVKSVGEDWEGFQKLVAESNIEDKDLILRVLSMYSDPAVRESEIRNMSEVYTSLKGEVLPELRRARFIANVEYSNYTDEELVELVARNWDVLDEPSLLHAATLVKDPLQKELLLMKCMKKFNSDKAKYNLAGLYLSQQKNSKAEQTLAGLGTEDPDVLNMLGVISLRKRDLEGAEKFFTASGSTEAKANMGVVDILNGNYEKAAEELKDAPGCCHNPALALILCGRLDEASKTIHCASAGCLYLRAIIAARQGKASEVKKYLEKASEKDASLKERAAKDIEFALYDL